MVKVCANYRGYDGACGVGWVYEEGWIITAAHTLADANVQVSIGFSLEAGLPDFILEEEDPERKESLIELLGAPMIGIIERPAQYMGSDKYRDIAAIKLNASDIPHFKPMPRGNIASLGADEEIVLIGQNSGLDADAKVGVLTKSWTISRGAISVIEFALNAIPGDSGGAFVDRQGQVLGIVQAGEPGVQNPGRIVGLPLSEIDKVWDRLKAGERINSDSLTWFDQEFGW